MQRINPEDINNEFIQNIGNIYLGKFGDKPSLYHANQPVAKMLKFYSLDSTTEDKWLFLANVYPQLNHTSLYKGTLAKLIRESFEAAFGKQIIVSSDYDLSMVQVGTCLRQMVIDYGFRNNEEINSENDFGFKFRKNE